MGLTTTQKVLWIAAGLATLAWGSWLVLDRPDVSWEAMQVEAFRPTFALPDADGRIVKSEDLRGRYQLVFFGFTNCPDVCPTTLALMAQLAREPALKSLQLVFVTVDPGRDDADPRPEVAFAGVRCDPRRAIGRREEEALATFEQALPGYKPPNPQG